jgi:hypothetical protein
VSNYRVCQVLALRLHGRQNRFLCGLATSRTDDSRTVGAAFDKAIAAVPNVNAARSAAR